MTKRAREHAGLVLALKAFKRCYRANGPGVSGPRWRTINRVQTARERMASELMYGYEFTREETELAIKILEGEKHDN